MRRLFPLAICLVIGLAVAACGKSQEEAKAPEAPPPEPAAAAAAPAPTADAAAIDAAIANTDRLAGDTDQDAWRRPAEVLKFMELRPGQHALDYFAAAGYYTELMSRVVGADGKVIAYNNPEYRKFSEDAPTKRYGNNRLPNVTELTTPVEAMPLDPASLDAALFMQSYHDLYWRPKEGSWPADRSGQGAGAAGAGIEAGRGRGRGRSRRERGRRSDGNGQRDASHRSGGPQARLRSRGPDVRQRKPAVREPGGRSHEGSVRQGDPPQDGSGDVQVQEERRILVFFDSLERLHQLLLLARRDRVVVAQLHRVGAFAARQ